MDKPESTNRMGTAVCFQEPYLEITHDEENQWLYADWKGYQTDRSVKEGINRLIELMAELKVFKILNDNTNVMGLWVEMAPWLVFDALPRARKANMKAFAHVQGASRFAVISAETALKLLDPGTPDIRSFDDIESAKDWLRKHP